MIVDPNIVYFLLVFGLWVTVTAAYVPGTGLIEVVALLAVGAAVLLLANQPTNWAAALLIFIGVLAFLLVPFLSPTAARVAEAGLLLQVIGAATLYNGESVSWVLIAVVVGLSLAYHRLALLPILEKSRKQVAVIDDNGQMLGAAGRVIRASEPVGRSHRGTVNVRGEQWSALSDHPLEPGEEIVVVERDGLQLYVESLKHKQALNNQRGEDTNGTGNSTTAQ